VWLYVAVDHTPLMRDPQGFSDLQRHRSRRAGWESTFPHDPVLEGAAGQVLHRYVVGTVL
jgi:hypothetical protein